MTAEVIIEELLDIVNTLHMNPERLIDWEISQDAFSAGTDCSRTLTIRYSTPLIGRM